MEFIGCLLATDDDEGLSRLSNADRSGLVESCVVVGAEVNPPNAV